MTITKPDEVIAPLTIDDLKRQVDQVVEAMEKMGVKSSPLYKTTGYDDGRVWYIGNFEIRRRT